MEYLIINNTAFLILEELETELCSFKWDPYADRVCKIVEYNNKISLYTREYGNKYLVSLECIQECINNLIKKSNINENVRKEKIKYNEYLLKRLTTHIRNKKIDEITSTYEDTLILAC